MTFGIHFPKPSQESAGSAFSRTFPLPSRIAAADYVDGKKARLGPWTVGCRRDDVQCISRPVTTFRFICKQILAGERNSGGNVLAIALMKS